MSRKSKREIERELEGLESNNDDTAPIVFNLTSAPRLSARSEYSHPELTIQSWPEQRPDSISLAIPSFLPKKYRGDGVIAVTSCDASDHYGIRTGSPNAPLACELWDALSEEQLREEKRIREANDDPIPSLLDDYDPKE